MRTQELNKIFQFSTWLKTRINTFGVTRVLTIAITLIALAGLFYQLFWPLLSIKSQIDRLATQNVQVKLVSSIDSDKSEVISAEYFFANPPKVSLKNISGPHSVKLDQIGVLAALAIVLSEDWAFFQHRGLDYYQIFKALLDSFETGKRLRGASTLGQQVVKNLFFSHERSFTRKLKEAFFTLYLEHKLSKARILKSSHHHTSTISIKE